MPISHYFAKKLLDHGLRNVAYTPPARVYLALYKSDPTAADTGTEVSGGGYSRKEIALSAAALVGGKMTVLNTANIPYDISTVDWGLITHYGIRDALTGGNLLIYEQLLNPRTIRQNDRYTGEQGQFPVSMT